jgi:hypothetical protein
MGGIYYKIAGMPSRGRERLPHHGSKHNINEEFIDMVNTNNYIICRNSSSSTSFTLPDRETIAKIVFFARKKTHQGKINFHVTKKIGEHLKFKDDIKEKYDFEILNLTTPLYYN